MRKPQIVSVVMIRNGDLQNTSQEALLSKLTCSVEIGVGIPPLPVCFIGTIFTRLLLVAHLSDWSHKDDGPHSVRPTA
jgi:hypothetical protein